MLKRPSGHRSRGQALAEFAIIFPAFMLLLGAVIQFGILFWAQNTLTQIARDTGRYASARTTCTQPQEVIDVAKTLAGGSSLIGYPTTPAWNSSNVEVTWKDDAGGNPITSGPNRNCPPKTNTTSAWVTITLRHTVPTFFPFIPGNGNLSTTAEFRMEPYE